MECAGISSATASPQEDADVRPTTWAPEIVYRSSPVLKDDWTVPMAQVWLFDLISICRHRREHKTYHVSGRPRAGLGPFPAPESSQH